MTNEELTIRIDERVKQLQEEVASLNKTLAQRFEDMDNKIDVLPQWKHVAIAEGSAFLALIGVVLRWILHVSG